MLLLYYLHIISTKGARAPLHWKIHQVKNSIYAIIIIFVKKVYDKIYTKNGGRDLFFLGRRGRHKDARGVDRPR